MDVVKEFLESSTIHGLSYISTSKVAKLIFFLSILCLMFNVLIILRLDMASSSGLLLLCLDSPEPWC